MSPYTTLTLRRGKAESLKRFHPWIFSGAIQSVPANLREGELVRVVDHESAFLAIGHYQIGSIAVRVLSFEDEEIDAAFWHKRIEQAYRMRCGLGLVRPDNNTYRLIHGEGDFLPGLIVDVYGRMAVMQAHSVGMHMQRHAIAEALHDVLAAGGNESIYYKSATTLPFKANLTDKEGFLVGSATEDVALEQGLKFRIDWNEGQKTGFFVDQRDNRRLLERYARGRRVLNMFCYTGGFSVYALRGGAEAVCSVDSSAKAIELTRENVALNFSADVAARHEAHAVDAFKFLDHAGDNFDLIVLDPPAFAKHRDSIRNAVKGYTRLNALGISKVRKGGIVFTFSCSQAISKEQFRLAVFTAAAQTGRRVRILHQLHQPADHPVNIYHPEGEYLKGLVLEVE